MCTTVTDQEIEEVCETITPEAPPPIPPLDPFTCFKKVCQTVNTTRLEKECQPIMYEECDVEIEEVMEERCKDFNTTSTEQECKEVEVEKCFQDFEYICEEVPPPPPEPHYGYSTPAPTPEYGYSTPAPEYAGAAYGPTTPAPEFHPSTPIPEYGKPPPVYTPSPYGVTPAPEVLPPVRTPYYGEKVRLKRSYDATWPSEGIDKVVKSLVSKHEHHYDDYAPPHPEPEYGAPPPPKHDYGPPPAPPVHCQYIPTTNCKWVSYSKSRICSKIAKIRILLKKKK